MVGFFGVFFYVVAIVVIVTGVLSFHISGHFEKRSLKEIEFCQSVTLMIF